MKSSLRWLDKEWKDVKQCGSSHCKNNNDIVHMGNFLVLNFLNIWGAQMLNLKPLQKQNRWNQCQISSRCMKPWLLSWRFRYSVIQTIQNYTWAGKRCSSTGIEFLNPIWYLPCQSHAISSCRYSSKPYYKRWVESPLCSVKKPKQNTKMRST